MTRETAQPWYERHAVGAGAVAWVLFVCAAVALRGVRWDEDYEFAQAILGIIPYPEGHPLFQYTRSMFSLQPYSLAALMLVFPGPLVANGLRNVLFLAATVLPPYLLGTLLTKRARWGHVAAALVLMGIHVPFYSNYPVQVWPGLYSNGPVGLGWMLLTLYLLEAGHRRTGYALLGLAPAVHLGQLPPLLLYVFVRFVYRSRFRRDASEWRRSLWALPGLAVCAALWLGLRYLLIPEAPSAGPYYATMDPETVFRGYMAHYASHRAIPHGTGHIAAAATLLLLPAAAWVACGRRPRMGPEAGLTLYAVSASILAYGTMAVHSAVGAGVPHLLIAWMPYRLINHFSPLLIPVAVSVLAGRDKAKPTAWLLLGALAFAFSQAVSARVLPEAVHSRYVSSGAAVYFGLCGATAAVLLQARDTGRFRGGFAALCAVALAVLAYVHQFGAACVVAGAVVAWALCHGSVRVPGRTWASWAAASVALLLVTQQTLGREHLPVSGFEGRVRSHLAAQGEDEAMILVHYQQEALQARLHHPVMTDMATLTWIPYKPALGPSLHKMYRDCYGIDLARADGAPGRELPWFEVWPAKPQAEWRRLGEEYGFRYVIAPAFMDLNLPEVIAGKHNRLFAVPLD